MTNTAKEIMNRFKNNNFQPINITMKTTGETLELKAKKINESKNHRAENITITVSKHPYELAIGGLEPIASFLRTYGTNETDGFATYPKTKTSNTAKLQKDILIDFKNFEPTDTEGLEMEGYALYKGKEYNVCLSAHITDLSYIVQAAEDIAEQIAKHA